MGPLFFYLYPLYRVGRGESADLHLAVNRWSGGSYGVLRRLRGLTGGLGNTDRLWERVEAKGTGKSRSLRDDNQKSKDNAGDDLFGLQNWDPVC